jgi:hypothetical protein
VESFSRHDALLQIEGLALSAIFAVSGPSSLSGKPPCRRLGAGWRSASRFVFDAEQRMVRKRNESRIISEMLGAK